MHRAHHCCTGNERGQQDDGQFARPSPAAPASTILLLRRTRSCRQNSVCTCIVAAPPPDTADPSDRDLRVGPCDCVATSTPGGARWRGCRLKVRWSLLVGGLRDRSWKLIRVGTCARRPGSHQATPFCLAALSAPALQPWHRLTSLWQTARASSCPSAAPATGPQAAITCTTLYLRNNRDAHILHGPSTGLAIQSGRQGHGQFQEVLFREAARRRFQSVLHGLNLRLGAQFPAQRLEA